MQEDAVRLGFRSVNYKVRVPDHERPLTKFKLYGLQTDVSRICEPPSSQVLKKLFELYSEARGT